MNQQKDVRGEKYNRLLITGLEPSKKTKWGHEKQVKVKCDCGEEKIVGYKKLKKGQPKSCGCLLREQILEVNPGDTYGNFTIIKQVDNYVSPQGATTRRFLCKCVCGKEVEQNLNSLTCGHVKSCGCVKPDPAKRKKTDLTIKLIPPLNIEKINQRDLGHWTVIEEISAERNEKGEIIRTVAVECKCGYKVNKRLDNVRKSKQCYPCATEEIRNLIPKEEREIKNILKNRYSSIHSRCYNPNCSDYPVYGGRGITICDEWKGEFLNFYQWAINNGFEKGLHIDRKDNDKGYSPDNCRFVPQRVNNQNTSRNVVNWDIVNMIRYGEYRDFTNKEISDILNCAPATIASIRKFETWKEDI